MLIGIGFLIISIFIYFKENYYIINQEEERIIEKKKNIKKDIRYRYKILISILSFVLGFFRLISLIIY